MSVPLFDIQEVLKKFAEKYSNADLESLRPLVDAWKTSKDITSRSNLPGHITTSAVIINEENKVLHIKHKILNKWLLPGGHCEEEDTSLISASLREVVEETGIHPENLKPIYLDDIPIDIDLHPISANPNKNEADHWHVDFRFVFRFMSSQGVTLQEEEVTDYAWLSLDQMPMRNIADRLLVLA